jgi:signal transduction histidine kinase
VNNLSARSRRDNESIHDKYELLEYFVGKLDSRNTPNEIYAFLLDFLQSIIGEHRNKIPGCVFTADEETGGFDPFVINSDQLTNNDFKSELDVQIDTGIVAWCIRSKRLAFTDSGQKQFGKHCIIIPLYTIECTLGLVLLYTDFTESDISRASFKILNLACLQTCLYVDILQMYAQLKSAQSRLIQSEKFAGIGQLAAGIAHEINNPVGFVTSNSSTLADYIDRLKKIMIVYRDAVHTPEIREKEKELKIDIIMDDIHYLIRENMDGLQRISDIVSAMKNFARTDKGRDRVTADINEGIKSTLLIARNEIKHHADVEMELGVIQPFKYNTGEINQVFLNILVNAAQAIQSQKRIDRGHIRIKTREDLKFTYCEISDDGPGIPQDILPKVFDPFFTTKPVGTGTGLGLSISFDIIVNRHGGELTVSSTEGEGATFLIKLPKN